MYIAALNDDSNIFIRALLNWRSKSLGAYLSTAWLMVRRFDGQGASPHCFLLTTTTARRKSLGQTGTWAPGYCTTSTMTIEHGTCNFGLSCDDLYIYSVTRSNVI